MLVFASHVLNNLYIISGADCSSHMSNSFHDGQVLGSSGQNEMTATEQKLVCLNKELSVISCLSYVCGY